MAKNDRKNTIPPEIINFLSATSGRSLLVKGGSGTGKTTFALQLLEGFASPENSFYLSTRVSDEALFSQFPWLREKEMKRRILDSSKMLLDVLYKKEEETPKEEIKTIATARSFLKSIDGEYGPPSRVDRTRLSMLIEENHMPEVESLYDMIDHILPNKAMVVVDSIEGITHKYGLEMEEVVMCFQKDLVENSNVNVVMVLEKADAGGIEYLADGLISMERGEIEERRVRYIHLEKLRATEISQPFYPITLKDGKFNSFLPWVGGKSSHSKWEIENVKEEFFSTGVPDLDELLGGGFKKGSYNGFEVGEGVSREEYYSILRPIFLSFLARKRGIIAILPGGEAPEIFRDDLTKYIDPEVFDNVVRIADYFAANTDKKYIMPLRKGTTEDALRIWRDGEKAARGIGNYSNDKGNPFIEYTGFDSLEYIQGESPAIKGLLTGVVRTKLAGDLGIGLLKPGLKVTKEVFNMMDTYFKIVSIGHTPCIYGIKPKTKIYAVTPDQVKGEPYINLNPIV